MFTYLNLSSEFVYFRDCWRGWYFHTVGKRLNYLGIPGFRSRYNKNNRLWVAGDWKGVRVAAVTRGLQQQRPTFLGNVPQISPEYFLGVTPLQSPSSGDLPLCFLFLILGSLPDLLSVSFPALWPSLLLCFLFLPYMLLCCLSPP